MSAQGAVAPMQQVNTTSTETSDKGHVRWYVWVILVVAVLLVMSFFAVRSMDSTLLVAQVQSVSGGEAVVLVSELGRTFSTEYVGSGLQAGDTVIVQVQGEDASLEFTSSFWVEVVTDIKELIP